MKQFLWVLMCLELKQWEATSGHASFYTLVRSPSPPPSPVWTLNGSLLSTASPAEALILPFISTPLAPLLLSFPEIDLEHIATAKIKLVNKKSSNAPPHYLKKRKVGDVLKPQFSSAF